jgi:hypothetical protein
VPPRRRHLRHLRHLRSRHATATKTAAAAAAAAAAGWKSAAAATAPARHVALRLPRCRIRPLRLWWMVPAAEGAAAAAAAAVTAAAIHAVATALNVRPAGLAVHVIAALVARVAAAAAAAAALRVTAAPVAALALQAVTTAAPAAFPTCTVTRSAAAAFAGMPSAAELAVPGNTLTPAYHTTPFGALRCAQLQATGLSLADALQVAPALLPPQPRAHADEEALLLEAARFLHDAGAFDGLPKPPENTPLGEGHHLFWQLADIAFLLHARMRDAERRGERLRGAFSFSGRTLASLTDLAATHRRSALAQHLMQPVIDVITVVVSRRRDTQAEVNASGIIEALVAGVACRVATPAATKNAGWTAVVVAGLMHKDAQAGARATCAGIVEALDADTRCAAPCITAFGSAEGRQHCATLIAAAAAAHDEHATGMHAGCARCEGLRATGRMCGAHGCGARVRRADDAAAASAARPKRLALCAGCNQRAYCCAVRARTSSGPVHTSAPPCVHACVCGGSAQPTDDALAPRQAHQREDWSRHKPVCRASKPKGEPSAAA